MGFFFDQINTLETTKALLRVRREIFEYYAPADGPRRFARFLAVCSTSVSKKVVHLSDFLSFRMCLSTSSTPLFSATARWMASYLSGGARSKTVATISQCGNFRSHGMTL